MGFLSHIDILEEKIKELEKRIGELEKALAGITVATIALVEEIRTFIMDDTDLTARVRGILSISPFLGKKDIRENIETFFENEKDFIASQKTEYLKDIALQHAKHRMGWILFMAKDKKIKFDEMSSLIIKVFGTDDAKDVVPLDSMIEYYGSDDANRWKKLVGI